MTELEIAAEFTALIEELEALAEEAANTAEDATIHQITTYNDGKNVAFDAAIELLKAHANSLLTDEAKPTDLNIRYWKGGLGGFEPSDLQLAFENIMGLKISNSYCPATVINSIPNCPSDCVACACKTSN